jgi:hypothetical protein
VWSRDHAARFQIGGARSSRPMRGWSQSIAMVRTVVYRSVMLVAVTRLRQLPARSGRR